jgi:hypothetical protein
MVLKKNCNRSSNRGQICIQILTSRKLTTSVNNRSYKPQDSPRSSTVEAASLLQRSSRRCSNSPPRPHLPTPPPATAGCFAVNDRQTEEKKDDRHATSQRPRPNYPNSMSRSNLRSRYNVFSRKCTEKAMHLKNLIKHNEHQHFVIMNLLNNQNISIFIIFKIL